MCNGRKSVFADQIKFDQKIVFELILQKQII